MTSSETPRRASVLSTAFNLINCAIGAGVLGVPFAVRSMGAVLGALSLCLVMAISVLTLNVLTRAARAYGASSYQELVRKSMGWFAAHVVSLTLVAYVFGSSVAYTIVCADSFGEFNQRAFGSGSIAANRSVIVLFTSTCVMLPLSLLRSMERMAFASSFSVLALLYTAVVVVAEGFDAVRALFFDIFVATTRHRSGDGGGGPDHHDFLASTPSRDVDDDGSSGSTPHVRAWVLDHGTVLALPVLVFAFQCHVQVVSIFAELRDPSRTTRKPSSSVQAAGAGIEPSTSAHEFEAAPSVVNGGWGKDFPRGNDEANEDEVNEGSDDAGDVFVDATSQSDFSGFSSLASSRGGSPAPTGGAGGGAGGGAEGGAEGADAGTHARRRSSGASGSTLSMILSPSPKPNRRRRLFSSSSSVGVGAPLGARTREGEAERAELDRSVTMERVSFWSMSTCLAGYLAAGVFAYVAHPDVTSNLLDAYPADDLPMLAASLLMGLSCAASYPINHFASRAALDDLYVAAVRSWKRRLKKTRGDRDDGGDDSGVTLGVTLGPTPAPPGQAPAGRHYAQTIAFVASTTALALAVDDLGVVFQLVGAVCGSTVIFILPGILLLLPGYHRGSSGPPGFEREPDEESGGVGGVGVRTADGGTHARASSRHWTEMGDSIGGYDELTFSGALDAPLLPGDGPNDGGNQGGVGAPRTVPRGAAALGAALVCAGGVIAAASVHLIFFADADDGAPGGSGFV